MENQLREYSFEYNETDGNFHQNPGNTPENTNGYKTVSRTRTSVWYPFHNMLKRHYDFASKNRPPFAKVKKEWEDYLLLLEDINKYKDY
ncbi:hypothetical protein ACM15_11090 [Parabacteroides goldsteinii]|uniref:Uncharacterized protein n=1 Tax=Parabacteroides goldsteinii TaxID=328812 RepID=A0A0J6CN16_9BACT|nr:hypothetical protein [Parabacteroides goldsteinii]KMM33564.1 hypothetical protein ACM15_11090 [Parabacteroides goldsteinii]